MESRAKVEPGWGKHSVKTNFPKDPSCHICLKTKVTRSSCRRRAGTVGPRVEPVGDLITADHKILSEESESRNSHRYAVVVEDLATQRMQSYPCKSNSSQETQKNLMKFLEPTRKPKVIDTDNSLEFGKSFEELSWNHIVSRNAQKQRRWKIIFSLQCRWGYDWNCFSHNYYCQSAQYLSNKNGETRIGKTIWPIVRANKLIDSDTQTFDWDSCTRKIIAQVQRTSGKASTTRSGDKDVYWCRIPENSWSRTVLLDKAHWRVLTICRASDISWVTLPEMNNQLTRKVGFEGTPKLDPCWNLQPVTCKVNMEW